MHSLYESLLHEIDQLYRSVTLTQSVVVLNESVSIPAQVNAIKINSVFSMILSQLTIVAALNAEPKSIPMI
jgi:hypothetical protein